MATKPETDKTPPAVERKTARGRDVQVAPHELGWSVSRSKGARTSRIVGTKAEAMTIARGYASEENAELVVRGRDGKVQHPDEHGSDPDAPLDDV